MSAYGRKSIVEPGAGPKAACDRKGIQRAHGNPDASATAAAPTVVMSMIRQSG
jgi:hypothetical protein